MFDNYTPFASPVMRQPARQGALTGNNDPGSAQLGSFDINQVMERLKLQYPDINSNELMAMAQAQIDNAQGNRSAVMANPMMQQQPAGVKKPTKGGLF